MACPGYVSIAMIKSMQKQLAEERVFQLTGHNPSVLGQALKAGTEAETTEECCFLASFPWLAQTTRLVMLFYRTYSAFSVCAHSSGLHPAVSSAGAYS